MRKRSLVPPDAEFTDVVWCEFCGRPWRDRHVRNDHIQEKHL